MDKTARRKKFKPGLKEISLMIIFQALQSASPRAASLMAYHLWFHPGRKSARALPEFQPAGTRAEKLKVNGKTVYYWSAGTGPGILLMHGWASCGNHMANLGQALLDQGYRIIWLDAPAHGLSSGWQSNLYEISDAISAVQKKEGEFHAVLAHSFGVPCTLLAIQNGLQVEKLVAISSPATATGLVDKFCKMIKAGKSTHELLIKRIEKFVGGTHISEIDAANLALNINHPSLVIHDKNDRMINCDEGRTLQKNLKNSSFVETRRLGHNKILNDPQTISLCVEFIQGKKPKLDTSALTTG